MQSRYRLKRWVTTLAAALLLACCSAEEPFPSPGGSAGDAPPLVNAGEPTGQLGNAGNVADALQDGAFVIPLGGC